MRWLVARELDDDRAVREGGSMERVERVGRIGRHGVVVERDECIAHLGEGERDRVYVRVDRV